jgi:ABC-type polysaccharide/polyol phosphate export permease
MVPDGLRWVLELNPLAAWYTMMHWSVFGAAPPGPATVVSFLATTAASLVVSHLLYTRLEPRFTKVL